MFVRYNFNLKFWMYFPVDYLFWSDGLIINNAIYLIEALIYRYMCLLTGTHYLFELKLPEY